MSKITETNAQYYQGAQGFREDGVFNGEYPTTFDVNLEFYSSDPADENYARNNFKVYTSPTGMPGTYVELTGVAAFTAVNNVVIFNPGTPALGTFVVVQLKKLDGGKYGQNVNEKLLVKQ